MELKVNNTNATSSRTNIIIWVFLGIGERISDYEDRENVEFAFKKLFILIPDSLHCKPKFDSDYLEKAKVILQNQQKY